MNKKFVSPLFVCLFPFVLSAATKSEPPRAIPIERMRKEKLRGDLSEIQKRRYIRVLVVPDKMTFFFDGAQPRGAAYEAMREFEVILNRSLNTGKLPLGFVFIPIRRDEILQALADGRGEIAAARLPITPASQKLVNFSDPIYDNASAVPVTGPKGPALASLADLAGKELYLVPSVASREILDTLNGRMRSAGKPEVKVKWAAEGVEVDDVLEMVNAGLVPITVMERSIAELWAQVFDGIKVHPEIVVAKGSLGWAVRKDAPQLLAAVNSFVKDHKVGTAFGSTVLRRYLKSTKWIRNSGAADDAARFKQMLPMFEQWSTKYDLPSMLLVAQAYQESRLNQQLTSSAGAVGVMQIKPTTAASKPIGIPDVSKLDRNIEAGAKYLRYMVDQYYKDQPMDQLNKGLFAVASYNAGPNRIKQLRDEAAAQGFDPNRWFNNVEIVASQRIGRETVQYVSNIYKYYLAYQMMTEHDTVAPKR